MRWSRPRGDGTGLEWKATAKVVGDHAEEQTCAAKQVRQRGAPKRAGERGLAEEIGDRDGMAMTTVETTKRGSSSIEMRTDEEVSGGIGNTAVDAVTGDVDTDVGTRAAIDAVEEIAAIVAESGTENGNSG